jgi:hypothetical protein
MEECRLRGEQPDLTDCKWLICRGLPESWETAARGGTRPDWPAGCTARQGLQSAPFDWAATGDLSPCDAWYRRADLSAQMRFPASLPFRQPTCPFVLKEPT